VCMSEKRTKADKALRGADQLEKKASHRPPQNPGKNHARTSAKPLCGSSKRLLRSIKPTNQLHKPDRPAHGLTFSEFPRQSY
jgi:hypothetical protein